MAKFIPIKLNKIRFAVEEKSFDSELIFMALFWYEKNLFRNTFFRLAN